MEVLLAACCIGIAHPSLLWSDGYFYEFKDVVANGNTAYVAAGASGVLVVDVTNPASPTLLGVCGVRGDTVRISGTRLYAMNDTGVSVCDVSDPSAPTVVGGFLSPSGRCSDMEVSGTKVFLLHSEQLHIIEAANPAAPTLLSAQGRVAGLDVMGEHQVVVLSVWGVGLQFYNVTGGVHLVGELNVTSPSWVRVSGGVAYVGCGSQGRDLCTVDVANPALPTFIGSVEVGYMSGFTVSGTMGYTYSWNGVYTINISNATSPSVVGRYPVSISPKGVTVTGTTVLLAGEKSSLLLVDSSVPADLKQVGQFGKRGGTVTVAVSGTVAVVSDYVNNHIRLYDVSDPSAATLLSTVHIDAPKELFILGTHVYLCVGSAYFHGSLVVIDITNPFLPSIVSNSNEKSKSHLEANYIWAEGHTAYATSSKGFLVIDVRRPSTPVLVSSTDFGRRLYGLTVVGRTAYVAALNGLVLVDVTNPLGPTQLGIAYLSGTSFKVAVSGEVAYVASSSDGLQVVDVSDRAAPSLLGHYDLYAVSGVSVVGKTAYVIGEKSGFFILDVSDPTTPVLIDGVFAGAARDVHVVGTTIYVASNGLQIFGENNGGSSSRPIGDKSESGSDGTPSWVWCVASLGFVLAGGLIVVAVIVLRKRPAQGGSIYFGDGQYNGQAGLTDCELGSHSTSRV